MTTSSPGSHSASMVAAMASVAPTVTSTSVLGVELEAVPGPLVGGHGAGAARARRGSAGTGCALRGWRVTATSRSSVGPVGVGEALAEVDRARRRGQLGHGGEDRGGEGLQPPGQVRVPRCHRDDRTNGFLARLSSGGPCSASPTSTCTAGWTGGAGPTTIVAAIAVARRRRRRARGDLDGRRGRGRRAGGNGRRAISATRWWRTPSARAAASSPSRTPTTAGSPSPARATATGRSTSTASAP